MGVEQSLSDESESPPAVCRLYTSAILADLVGVPVSAVRRWHRRGLLRAVRCARRTPYFDFEEAAVARRLAQLLKAGCSLRTIDRRLAEFERLAPEIERPLADPDLVIEGQRLFWRRGDDVAEPGGQLLLDFTARGDDPPPPAVIALPRPGDPTGFSGSRAVGRDERSALDLVERIEQDALDWEDAGRLDRAAEAYRAALMIGGPRAEIHFALADVLYRGGDVSAARERYYAALELDDEYVEARAALGSLLAETGELELAAATFEGALAVDPDFADAHFHLAQVLDRLDRGDLAARHYRAFLNLAPESPWAAATRDRLAAPPHRD